MNLDLIKKKYSFGKVKGYMTTEAKYLFSICFLAGLWSFLLLTHSILRLMEASLLKKEKIFHHVLNSISFHLKLLSTNYYPFQIHLPQGDKRYRMSVWGQK